MPLKLRARLEAGCAVGAGVGKLGAAARLAVGSLVPLESAGMREGLAADLAAVGPGAQVGAAVPHQVAGAGEGLSTHLAAKQLLARVAEDMGAEQAAARECQLAVGAGVGQRRA